MPIQGRFIPFCDSFPGFPETSFFRFKTNEELGFWEGALIDRLEEESIQLQEILLQPTKNLVETHDALEFQSRQILDTIKRWTIESIGEISASGDAKYQIRKTYEDGMGDSEVINIVEHRIRAFKIAVQKLMN